MHNQPPLHYFEAKRHYAPQEQRPFHFEEKIKEFQFYMPHNNFENIQQINEIINLRRKIEGFTRSQSLVTSQLDVSQSLPKLDLLQDLRYTIVQYQLTQRNTRSLSTVFPLVQKHLQAEVQKYR